MASLLDIIGATIIAGMVILIIIGVTANLNQTLYTSTYSLNAQMAALTMARIIEYDFYKMGYNVNKATDTLVLFADTSRIRFKSDLLNQGVGAVTRMEYSLGGLVGFTPNPKDRFFSRIHGNSTINSNLGITRFRLMYYDSTGKQITTPISHIDSLKKIKAIKVTVNIESPEPVIPTSDPNKRDYIGIYWEKLIYPRNLQSY